MLEASAYAVRDIVDQMRQMGLPLQEITAPFEPEGGVACLSVSSALTCLLLASDRCPRIGAPEHQQLIEEILHQAS